MGSGISACQSASSTQVQNSLRSLRDPDTRKSCRKTTILSKNRVAVSPRKEIPPKHRSVSVNTDGSFIKCSQRNNNRNNDKIHNNKHYDEENHKSLNNQNVHSLNLFTTTTSTNTTDGWIKTNCTSNDINNNDNNHTGGTIDSNAGLSDSCDSGIMDGHRKRRQLLSKSRRDQFTSHHNGLVEDLDVDPGSIDSSKDLTLSQSDISTDLARSIENFNTSITNVEKSQLASSNNSPAFDTRYNRPISRHSSLRSNRRSAPNMLQLAIDEAEEDDEYIRQSRPPRPKSAHVRKRRNNQHNTLEETEMTSVNKDSDDDFWSAESSDDDEDFYSDILSIPDETTTGQTPRGEANVKLGPKFSKITTCKDQSDDWWTALAPLEDDDTLAGTYSARTPRTFRSLLEGIGGNNLGKKASERSLSSVILLSPCGDHYLTDPAAITPSSPSTPACVTPRSPACIVNINSSSGTNNNINFNNNINMNNNIYSNYERSSNSDYWKNSPNGSSHSLSHANEPHIKDDNTSSNDNDLHMKKPTLHSINSENDNNALVENEDNNITLKSITSSTKEKNHDRDKNHKNVVRNDSSKYNNNDNTFATSVELHNKTDQLLVGTDIADNTPLPSEHLSNTNPVACSECLHANHSTSTTSRPSCECHKDVKLLEEHVFTLVLALTQKADVSLVDFQNMVLTSRPRFLQVLSSISETRQTNKVVKSSNAKGIQTIETSLAQSLYNIGQSVNPSIVSALVLRHLSSLKSVCEGNHSTINGGRLGNRGEETGEESELEDERDDPDSGSEEELMQTVFPGKLMMVASNPGEDRRLETTTIEDSSKSVVTGLPPTSTNSLAKFEAMSNRKDRSRISFVQRSNSEQVNRSSEHKSGIVESNKKSPTSKQRPDSGIVLSSSASYSSSSETAREAEIDVTSQTEWIAKSLEMLQQIYMVRTEDHDTIKSLVKSITLHCDSDQLKAHAIYRWLSSQSLAYYAKSLPGTKSSSPTLKLKQLADGKLSYASLYQEMARSAGLRCEKIDGYAKGSSYRPGSSVRSPDNQHSWNAVSFNGHYALIDAEFGSLPYKFFVEHYFMTPPDEFRLSHYPKDKKWLLMTQAISIEDFDTTLKTWPTMVAFNIRPLNMRSVLRTFDGRLSITVLLRSVAVTPQLEYHGPGPDLDSDSLALLIDQEIRSVDNAETFHVSLPQEGTYYFTLLVHDVEEDEDIPVFQYRIEYKDELL